MTEAQTSNEDNRLRRRWGGRGGMGDSRLGPPLEVSPGEGRRQGRATLGVAEPEGPGPKPC